MKRAPSLFSRHKRVTWRGKRFCYLPWKDAARRWSRHLFAEAYARTNLLDRFTQGPNAPIVLIDGERTAGERAVIDLIRGHDHVIPLVEATDAPRLFLGPLIVGVDLAAPDHDVTGEFEVHVIDKEPTP